MCDKERSELWGELTVGVAAMSFATVKIKNIKVDAPHGKFGPHIQYGPYYPNSSHPMYHFGPRAPKGGSGSWEGLSDWISKGGGWQWE